MPLRVSELIAFDVCIRHSLGFVLFFAMLFEVALIFSSEFESVQSTCLCLARF